MDQRVEIQYDLYLAAYLNEPKKSVLIPDYWCDTFNLASSINKGLNRNENHRIFFSPDINKVYDFTLPARDTFDADGDGCYFGKILRAFNSKADAVAYISRRRAILPPVYNPKQSQGRTTQQTRLLSQREFNSALGSGYAAMGDRFAIKTEKFCEEIGDLRKRIVNYNIGVDGLDDSDIEFLEDEIDEADDSEEEYEAIVQPVPNAIEANETSNVEDNAIEESDAHVSVPEVNMNENSHKNEQHDDVLNGLLNSVENEVNDYYYPEFDTSIRAPIAKVLRAWNSNHPFNTYLYDKRFLGVLLREVFGGQNDQFDPKRISFVKRLFEVRVKGDKDRLNNFDAIVEEKQQKADNKHRSALSDN